MNKTVLKAFTKEAIKTHITVSERQVPGAASMAKYLQVAAHDLLQPRPQAINALLESARRLN